MTHRIVFFLCIVFSSPFIFGQSFSVKGRVVDNKNEALFPVSIWLKSNDKIGATTNLDGDFLLNLNQEFTTDSLVFSSLGYTKKIIPIISIQKKDSFIVKLAESTISIDAVTIISKSISEEFSVTQLSRLDIYLSPSSSADPLKMLTMLPVSTNTDETANPVLRGSSAERSMVYLNGTPISDPVKNSQINGIGFFSLFNTAIIKNENVYASNPPLIYGNSSAGIIEIETDDKLKNDEVQVSASLASFGLFISKHISEKSFVQLYGNAQFSDAFLQVNKRTQINNFSSKDLGLNYHWELSDKSSVNLYSYLISESSNINLHMFLDDTYTLSKTVRNFNILNYKFISKGNIFTVNLSNDYKEPNFKLGNIKSKSIESQIYYSLNFKKILSTSLSCQIGLTDELYNGKFNVSLPLDFYVIADSSLTKKINTSYKIDILEGYIYVKWQPINKINLGIGLRKNIDLAYADYLSFQTNLKYEVNKKQSILAGLGSYHSYGRINYKLLSMNLLSSTQAHLEYCNENDFGLVKLAMYVKLEKGDTIKERKIFGIECSFQKTFLSNFKWSISNSSLRSIITDSIGSYKENSSFNYFIKTSLSYTNIKIFSLGIDYVYHPGLYYTPVVSSTYDSGFDTYYPVYSSERGSRQLQAYSSINVSVNKIFYIKKNSLICFVSIMNLLNNKNQRSLAYYNNYLSHSYNYNQARSIYFGIVLDLKL